MAVSGGLTVACHDCKKKMDVILKNVTMRAVGMTKECSCGTTNHYQVRALGQRVIAKVMSVDRPVKEPSVEEQVAEIMEEAEHFEADR